MNEKRFEEAKNKVIGMRRTRDGIGTLQEKTVHAILKNYYAPDPAMHEVSLQNYVADIYTGEEIIEIQNGNFYKIRSKLEAFLEEYPVTVVYPIPHTKWLIWIDEVTGELSKKRKSPVTGNAYLAFNELYRIKPYLKNANLKFCFPLMDVEEYRLLNGWSSDKKKGSCRHDRIPVALFEEVIIERKEDYLQFLPYELPPEFTSADLAKKAKIPLKTANLVLNILHFMEVVKRIGKSGRFFLYKIADDLD
ncbi:MAG: hypothetical protein GX235_05680 [Clostridiales bacterium]|nr:hypothetical protein [Clostridiales bacterium]